MFYILIFRTNRPIMYTGPEAFKNATQDAVELYDGDATILSSNQAMSLAEKSAGSY